MEEYIYIYIETREVRRKIKEIEVKKKYSNNGRSPAASAG